MRTFADVREGFAVYRAVAFLPMSIALHLVGYRVDVSGLSCDISA